MAEPERALARADGGAVEAPRVRPVELTAHRQTGARVQRWAQRLTLAVFLASVVVPTTAVGIYYYVFASDIYVTTTQFAVRRFGENGVSAGSALGVILSGLGSGNLSMIDTASIVRFMQSHDAVAHLDESIGLRAIYQRPEADSWARLSDEASFEAFVGYYKGMTQVQFDQSSGIVTIEARAYTAADAKAIAAELLTYGEELVNRFNLRAHDDLLASAREELTAAEAELADVQDRITGFRIANEDLDPQSTAGAAGEIIAGLRADLADAEAALQERSSYLLPDSPQIQTLETRIGALQDQIALERDRLAGPGSTAAPLIAAYDRLLLERELAMQKYSGALTSLQSALAEGRRQQLYLVPVVAPNVADEALRPYRLQNTLLVLFGSLALFGIGRLLVAGVQDHML